MAAGEQQDGTMRSDPQGCGDLHRRMADRAGDQLVP
jgi:hypothetical protein